MRDIKNNIDVALSLGPAARTATVNGAGIDVQGYNAALAVVQFGTWTDGTHTPSLQESDDNSVFTAIAAADLQGSFSAVSSAGGNNTVQRVGYIGGKRYLRGVMTIGSATTGAVSAFAVVRALPAHPPV